MKQLYVLVLTLFLSFQLWGQESVVLDRITLNTGEIYIGEIVVKTADIVMIKSLNGTRYQFQLVEVKKIDKTNTSGLAKNQTANRMVDAQIDGNFSGQLEITGGISSAKFAFTTSPNAQVSLTFGNKKVFGKDLFLGIGAGYNNTFIESSATSLALIPVFVRLQSTLTKGRTAPFVGVDAGYAFSLNPNFGGGSLIKVSIGIVSRLNYKTALIIGVYAGLNSISGNLTETNDLGTFTYYNSTMMQNVGVKLGLQF